MTAPEDVDPPVPLVNKIFPEGREMILVRRVQIIHKDSREDCKLKPRYGVRVRVLGVVELDAKGWLPE